MQLLGVVVGALAWHLLAWDGTAAAADSARPRSVLLLYAETRLAPAIVQASGFELQQRLATAGAPIPAIFITAHDDPITRERAVGRGYLKKPFREDALIGAIQQALGGRGV